jgi:hypothetical protein
MIPLYPVRAARIRKARRTSTCLLCHQPVYVGDQIGKTPIGWCHTSCIINRAKKLETAQ